MGCSTKWPLWVPRGSVSAAAVVAAAPRPGCQCKAEVLLAAVPSLMHAGRHPGETCACVPAIHPPAGMCTAWAARRGWASGAMQCCSCCPGARLGTCPWGCCCSSALHHAHARPMKAGHGCSLGHVPAFGVPAPQLPHCTAPDSMRPCSERGYVQHLGTHGVSLREQPVVPLLNHVLGADRKVRGTA